MRLPERRPRRSRAYSAIRSAPSVVGTGVMKALNVTGRVDFCAIRCLAGLCIGHLHRYVADIFRRYADISVSGIPGCLDVYSQLGVAHPDVHILHQGRIREIPPGASFSDRTSLGMVKVTFPVSWTGSMLLPVMGKFCASLGWADKKGVPRHMPFADGASPVILESLI